MVIIVSLVDESLPNDRIAFSPNENDDDDDRDESK